MLLTDYKKYLGTDLLTYSKPYSQILGARNEIKQQTVKCPENQEKGNFNRPKSLIEKF